MMSRRNRRRGLAVLAVTLIVGCQSSPLAIEPDLAPAEYFQHAQEATVNTDYALAMQYYQTFRDRFAGGGFPEQIGRLLWADYEIAFLHHKQGEDETAIELLVTLVERYEQQDAVGYPAGPRTLALRVIAELQSVAEQSNAAADEPSAEPPAAAAQ